MQRENLDVANAFYAVCSCLRRCNDEFDANGRKGDSFNKILLRSLLHNRSER